jgi:hypothetical protein
MRLRKTILRPGCDFLCTCPSVLIVSALALLVFWPGAARGQEQQPAQQPYWVVSYYEVPWARVDSLVKLYRQHRIPVVEEAKRAGTILDYRILIHHFGSEENVVIMEKYPSWEAIDRGTGFGEAARRLGRDEEAQRQISEGFDWVFEGVPHRDEIYAEAGEFSP